jgi:hypothetical protein
MAFAKVWPGKFSPQGMKRFRKSPVKFPACSYNKVWSGLFAHGQRKFHQLHYNCLVKLQTRFLPFILLSILGLLFALWAGLLRLGWALPTFNNLALLHGPLMISGFLGVLIPLERAVAIRQRWMFAVPLVSGLGWISLLFAPDPGAVLLTLGSFGTLGILAVMVRREPHIHSVIMALGALSWVVGNVLWMSGMPVFQVVFYWMSFLILTIGGERLELNRVLRPTPGQIRLFAAIVGVLLAGTLVAAFDQNLGSRLFGFSLLGFSFWFLRFDLAQLNLHHPAPLTRYIARCLFGGFLWLGFSGGMFIYFGALYAGPLYDAALHSFFVGFVIAMIFGHAPIIFPGILGVPIQFSRAFYAHLALLHLSMVLRVFGDVLLQIELRKWGGLLNEAALLLFLGMTVRSIIKGAREQSQ